MTEKNETITSTSRQKVAVLTKDWTYQEVSSGKSTTVPAGQEYIIGARYNNTDLLPNGNLRWFYWDIPRDHFKIVLEEVTTTTTVVVKRIEG